MVPGTGGDPANSLGGGNGGAEIAGSGSVGISVSGVAAFVTGTSVTGGTVVEFPGATGFFAGT